MSFEKIDIKDNKAEEGRSCIIVCNFNGKELKAVKNYASMLGIRDQIFLSAKDGNSVIKDVLEDNIVSNCEDGIKQKAIIFNCISPAKMNIFLDNLKKIRINNILKAVVTETSKEWSINILLSNLIAENRAIKLGEEIEHKM